MDWKVAIAVIEDYGEDLTPYEIYEIEKGDALFDLFTSDPNWAYELLSYTRNDYSRHPGSNSMSWGAFKNNLNSLIGHPKTFIYISDHIPMVPGPDAIQFHGSHIDPRILASSLPQGENEQHVLVLVGGDSGRLTETLCSLDLPGNLIISSTSPHEGPPMDKFDMARGMSSTNDPESAFTYELKKVLHNQTPFICISETYQKLS